MATSKATASKTASKKETSSNPGSKEETPASSSPSASSIYEFTIKDLDGKEVSLDKYKGYVTLIVNVASRCGHTSKNYSQLVELDEKYRDAGLRIAAFPCNQFGGQEPGTCETIKGFVAKKGVKFDVYEKIQVNGANAHPLYQYLKSSRDDFAQPIKWNFVKFLVNKKGVPVKRYLSGKEPKVSESRTNSIEQFVEFFFLSRVSYLISKKN